MVDWAWWTGARWTGIGSRALVALGGDLGEQVLESFAVLFGDDHGDAHAEARLYPLHETIDFDGHFHADAGGEAGADPQRIGRFDEHAIGTDITCPGAKNCRTPFDLEIGAVVIARSPASLQAPWMVASAHV